jgi:hypothetical protein
MIDGLVTSAGPGGVLAALRAADFGAQTALVKRRSSLLRECGWITWRAFRSPTRPMRSCVAVKAAHELGLAIASKHTRRHKQFGEC